MTLAAITNLPKCAALGKCSHEEIHPDSVDTEMMDYYDHDERGERKQMHQSSGSVRIYKAGPDEGGGGARRQRGREATTGMVVAAAKMAVAAAGT